MCNSITSPLISSCEGFNQLVKLVTNNTTLNTNLVQIIAESIYYWNETKKLTNLDQILLPGIILSIELDAWIPMSLMRKPSWDRVKQGLASSIIFDTNPLIEQLDVAFNRLAMNQMITTQLQKVLDKHGLTIVFMCTCKSIVTKPLDAQLKELYQEEQSLRNLTHGVPWESISVDSFNGDYFGVGQKSLQLLSDLQRIYYEQKEKIIV